MVARSNAPHTGTVWPTIYTKKGAKGRYMSQRHGREYSVLTTSSGGIRFESVQYASDAYYPDREVVRLEVSANHVSEAEATEILARYIDQRASGHTESVQRWDREKVEARTLCVGSRRARRLLLRRSSDG